MQIHRASKMPLQWFAQCLLAEMRHFAKGRCLLTGATWGEATVTPGGGGLMMHILRLKALHFEGTHSETTSTQMLGCQHVAVLF